MTHTAHPAIAASYTADDVKRMLADGKTVEQVAELASWPRQSVTAVINGIRGWMLDPQTDKAYQFKGVKRVPVTLPDGVAETPATTTTRPSAAIDFREPVVSNPIPMPGSEPTPGEVLAATILDKARTRPPAPDPAPAPAPGPVVVSARQEPVVREPTKLLNAIDTVLELLADHDDPAVAKDITRVSDALAKLHGTLTASEERRQAEAALAAAERAVADAKAKLRDLKSGKSTTKATPPASAPVATAARNTAARASNTAIRVWACEQGIKIPSRGRMPTSVRQQYDAAHPS